MAFIYYFAIVLFILLCALICLVVLMQESKATGLGASFGGDAQESVFGTGTAEVLKKFTSWLGITFLVACLILSFWTSAMGRSNTAAIPFKSEQRY